MYDRAAGKTVKGVTADSRKVKKGDVFVCLVGEHVDGHVYVAQAVRAGAIAVVVQSTEAISKPLLDTLPVLRCDNTYKALAMLSARFYGKPAEMLTMVGVTGTNGKTTVVHLVEKILAQAGRQSALLGTLGLKSSVRQTTVASSLTTPMAEDLQQQLAMLKDEGFDSVVMEVSSHALWQDRVYGCDYDVAVFTNLTQDHLDYHKTMEAYFQAKALLFTGLKPASDKPKAAVINLDSEYGLRLKTMCPTNVQVLTYGLKTDNPDTVADVRAENLQYSIHGATFDCRYPGGSAPVSLKIAGQFGVYNALAAIATGLALNIDMAVIKAAVESVDAIRGRFEVVADKPVVVVDYAHTPDGLQNILSAVKAVIPKGGRMITVFGCGGDRDVSKRPKMGRIAETMSDLLVVTSDNPRTEDPQQIITDILAGIERFDAGRMQVNPDRLAAIHQAIDLAKDNDVVVVAGKGHEDYQILADRTIHFDDRQVVQEYLKSNTPV
ncbi:MAG: UDP-N-acetylmuramoyl-L-alanyl-D-glutamate--2,6-diaminopimelate ligase [Cyanobacteria bacterium HKST-UBA04]|nr:UDP-N-acetylmuramoyl-L-alanyl-D-glutamate--2,6-diaminopimelate ligase [Cyanobacteria bacterium HKST-UBA04]